MFVFLGSLDWGLVATYAIALYFTWEMAITAYQKRDWIEAYRNISWLLMIADAIVLGSVIGIWMALDYLSPQISGISWLNLLGGKGTNVTFMAASTKYLGTIFIIVALFAIPYFAKWEEKIFRLGTTSWNNGIWRSLVFGLFHMIVGVPLGAAFGIAGAGLFFTFCYFKGGIRLSSQAHFQYNLIILTFLLINSIVVLIA